MSTYPSYEEVEEIINGFINEKYIRRREPDTVLENLIEVLKAEFPEWVRDEEPELKPHYCRNKNKDFWKYMSSLSNSDSDLFPLCMILWNIEDIVLEKINKINISEQEPRVMTIEPSGTSAPTQLKDKDFKVDQEPMIPPECKQEYVVRSTKSQREWKNRWVEPEPMLEQEYVVENTQEVPASDDKCEQVEPYCCICGSPKNLKLIDNLGYWCRVCWAGDELDTSHLRIETQSTQELKANKGDIASIGPDVEIIPKPEFKVGDYVRTPTNNRLGVGRITKITDDLIYVDYENKDIMDYDYEYFTWKNQLVKAELEVGKKGEHIPTGDVGTITKINENVISLSSNGKPWLDYDISGIRPTDKPVTPDRHSTRRPRDITKTLKD